MILAEVIIIKIGFIGMGKCGMSLAYYFRSEGAEVIGFSSRHTEKNDDFKILTDRELVNDSDVIFITAADDDIPAVWERIREFDLSKKIVCHCSGSLPSGIFKGANPDMVCSVHPMLAFSSGHTSPKAVREACFTLEGGIRAADTVKKILKNNRVVKISAENKALYHTAACFASNFAVSVCETAELLLLKCGFSREDAHSALVPLIRENTENIISMGTHKAVTGPAARGDIKTIASHSEALKYDNDTLKLYSLLTDVILKMKEERKI